jgi:hypothetical protein
MGYALLIRTMPSSLADLAAPDGNNVRANANSATEQMLRMNMDLLLVATGVNASPIIHSGKSFVMRVSLKVAGLFGSESSDQMVVGVQWDISKRSTGNPFFNSTLSLSKACAECAE